MFNIDPVFSSPDFTVTVTGGSFEENAQMATAIGHAMRICGFNNAQIDPSLATVPENYNSVDVLNSIRNLNPDLFESCFQVTGQCEQAPALGFAPQAMMPTQQFPMPGYFQF